MISDQHIAGIGATLLLHLSLGALAVSSEGQGCSAATEAKATSTFDQARVIEAGLAIKKIETKKRQPQKRKKKKFKPKDAPKFSRDEARTPIKKKPKKELRADADEIDFDSVLKKNRAQEEDLSSSGAEERAQAGVDTDFSGRLRDAKGDPYVALLVERIYDVWQVPGLETGSGKTMGCIRLHADGKVAETEVKRKSKNSRLNRSVEVALKKAPDMAKPVPKKLVELLTRQGICIDFKLEAD